MKNLKNPTLVIGCLAAGAVLLYIFWPPDLDFAEREVNILTQHHDGAQAHARELMQQYNAQELNRDALADAERCYNRARGGIHGCVNDLLTGIEAGGVSAQRATEIHGQFQEAYSLAEDFQNWKPALAYQPGPVGQGGPELSEEKSTSSSNDEVEAFKSLVKFAVDTRREVYKERINKLKQRLTDQLWGEFDQP